MTITSRLVHALERADNPRAIRALSWGLERATGFKANEIVGSFDTVSVSSWYEQHGYNRIAGLGGYGSASGVSVTPDTAFEVSAVLACVKIISEDMGSLGFYLYRRSEDGLSTEKARTHTLFPILSGLTSPETSSGEFIEALNAHALLVGDGFALIQRNPRTDEPMYLFPIMPQSMRMDRDSHRQLVYLVKQDGGAEKTYPQSGIFHLRGFTLNGVRGENILQRTRQVIGLASVGQQYAGAFFANDASPGIVLSRPATAGVKPLGPESVKAIKEGWVKWHQGVKRAHEPAVLQDGMTISRMDPDHQKMQLIEMRRFQIEEICRIFRMPPHKIADLSRSTNNNIEYQGIEYITNTLFPWRRRWRDAVHRCLFTRTEQLEGRLYADHNVEALLRGDFATQSAGFAALLEKGAYTINEVRRWMNLNPVPGGDKNFVQLNMAAIADVAKGAVVQSGAKLMDLAGDL